MLDHAPIVLKLGGSLLDWPGLPVRLLKYLEPLRRSRPLLIVGGGGAADFIRSLDSAHGIGEKRAHELALRSLDLTARCVESIVPGTSLADDTSQFREAWHEGIVPILMPRDFLERFDRPPHTPLPACWEVTTDSIAARVAEILGARELHLLKSTGLGGVETFRSAAAAGLVDNYFPNAAAGLERVFFVNLRGDPATSELLIER